MTIMCTKIERPHFRHFSMASVFHPAETDGGRLFSASRTEAGGGRPAAAPLEVNVNDDSGSLRTCSF